MGLRRYHLSKDNRRVLTAIARRLPSMSDEVFIPHHTNETFRKVFNWLANKWLTGWACRMYFRSKYIASVDINHKNRLKKAFQEGGIVGLMRYFKGIYLPVELIEIYLNEIIIDRPELERQVAKLREVIKEPRGNEALEQTTNH